MRLIYKPKSLAVEAAFQDLLRWTRQKGFEPSFRTLRLLDRSLYGWVEFIEASSCSDETAVRRFYQRQGGYLALLWLLDATDFHWKNLIASGEHPVLVDLETLFVPRQRELGTMVDEGRGRHARYDFGEGDPPSRKDLLAAAVEVGDRLAAIALCGPRDAHWLAAQRIGSGGKWTLQPARLDLHLGLPGIILFLAWLGELTGETRFIDLARAALVTLRDQIPHGGEILSNIGAYAGWGGLVWVLTHLGVLWGDEELLAEAARIAHDEIPPGIPVDENNDLISGASGCLIALLTFHQVRPSDRLLASAVQCGERLLARARPMERELGWHLKVAGPTPLAGLSHGVAGIAWPLLRLTAETGDHRFRETALRALEYERSLYNPTKRNWPDLREGATLEEPTEPHYIWAWCHGAPGVGLGRLAGLPYLDDASVREEIEIAVESTIDNGFGRGHCLCHGDLGNLEVVTLAAERLGRPDWALRSGRIAGGILAGLRERGWLFGLPGRTEPPGMMIGLAGIGYGLLRLAAPERVPSVLVLEDVKRARK